MTPVHFTPASNRGWIAFSTESRVLVVGASPDDAFVEAVWSAIRGDDALQRSLDLLTGKGLSATPPFALLDWSAGPGPLRVIVRGDVAVALTGAADESLSGTGVSTWIERLLDGVTSAVVTVDAALAAETPALPLVSGAAWISSLTVAVAEPAPVADPAPVAEPVEATAAPVADPTPVAEPVEAPEPTPTTAEIDIEATVSDAPSESIDNLETSAEGYDYAFGDTMYRSVADAAVRDGSEEAPTAEASVGPVVDPVGDHDGHTVLTSDIAKLRGRRRPKTQAAPVQPAAQTVTLVLSNGAREPLTQPILVGRSPSVSQVSGDKMPRLITVGGADQDISRTHVRFVLEGDTVVVTDLHSRNGTTIAMPGKEAQKLRAGEPTSVIVGTVVDLGGGVTLTVDED